ncbi:MAG: SURF1 family protein [Gemmatimonadota bacterium]|nr:SURF1 family protein [Gemmatimonadota bacterium]
MSSFSRRAWFSITVMVTLACLALSLWQLGRRTERRTQNALAIAGRGRPLLDLRETNHGEDRRQRRVVAGGSYDYSAEIILRGHLLTGAPGVHVVTPLRLAGSDSAVLVNRGFVPAADGATPDFPVPIEAGTGPLRGLGVAVPSDGDGGSPVTGSRGTSWRRLDLAAMRARVPYPLLDVYLLAEPDTARRGWPRRIEPPPLSEGNHLSYALQWLGIGVAVIGFGLFFVLGIGRGAVQSGPPAPPPIPEAR